jgi:hypothetical protein
MNPRALAEMKIRDANLLRERIGFPARPGELRGEGVRPNATAIATAPGRRAPPRSSCASRTAHGRLLLPAFLGPSGTAEDAPTDVVQGRAKSQVNRLYAEIEDKVKAFSACRGGGSPARGLQDKGTARERAGIDRHTELAR